MKGSPMTQSLYDYIVTRFAPMESELLKAMAARAQRAGLPMIMIGEDQARFVHWLLRMTGARTCLDIGTLFGYSAAIMAKAMGPEGRVVSLEMERRHADVARENLEAAGVATQVDVQVGVALDLIKKLAPASFDFVLIDADKEGYTQYFGEALRVIRPGGIIAADNTLAWGRVAEPETSLGDERDVRAIQKFNDRVAKSSQVESCLLPLGDGLLLARVKD